MLKTNIAHRCDVYIHDTGGWVRLTTVSSTQRALSIAEEYRANGRLMGWFEHGTGACDYDNPATATPHHDREGITL